MRRVKYFDRNSLFLCIFTFQTLEPIYVKLIFLVPYSTIMNSRMPVHNQIYLYDSDKCTLCDLNVVGDEYH